MLHCVISSPPQLFSPLLLEEKNISSRVPGLEKNAWENCEGEREREKRRNSLGMNFCGGPCKIDQGSLEIPDHILEEKKMFVFFLMQMILLATNFAYAVERVNMLMWKGC